MCTFEDLEALKRLQNMHLITLLTYGTLSGLWFKYLRALWKYHPGQEEHQEYMKTH